MRANSAREFSLVHSAVVRRQTRPVLSRPMAKARAAVCAVRNHQKRQRLRSPMQVPMTPQWWSNVRTHLLQCRQWCARAGCRLWQWRHCLAPAAARAAISSAAAAGSIDVSGKKSGSASANRSIVRSRIATTAAALGGPREVEVDVEMLPCAGRSCSRSSSSALSAKPSEAPLLLKACCGGAAAPLPDATDAPVGEAPAADAEADADTDSAGDATVSSVETITSAARRSAPVRASGAGAARTASHKAQGSEKSEVTQKLAHTNKHSCLHHGSAASTNGRQRNPEEKRTHLSPDQCSQGRCPAQPGKRPSLMPAYRWQQNGATTTH